MIVRTQASQTPRHATLAKPRPPLRRRAMCQFIALALFGGGAHAATPPAFSPAWFAAKQATATQPVTPTSGTGGTAGAGYTPGNVMLQQRVQQSIANLDAAAQAVAAQMSAQKSAQSAAQALVSTVPNGLGDGGLKVDSHVAGDSTLWQNANAPTQSTSNGQTTVEVKQNAAKAIMSWETFNVGRQTTVHFDQTGGTQTDGSNQWIALNRVTDPTGKPSQILGQIKAEGTVYLLNRNGVIFGGGAQVDTHSLIASSLDLFTSDVSKSNAFFMKYGIGATQDPEHILPAGDVTFLTSGSVVGVAEPDRGAVVVEKGALISGSKDGFLLLSAPTVSQAGQLVADDGQVILSAAPGLVATVSASGNLNVASTLQFSAIAAPHGTIANTGLIQARRGGIHWLADEANQDGVVVTSTSLSQPGSVVFDPLRLTQGSKVTFGLGSVTTVLPEKDGTTTSSSAAADAAFVPGSVSINANAVMEPGSLLEVPAGHVTFGADAYMAAGSIVDVSGLANVTLPMSALLVIIPRIGLNELADSPLLRNSPLFAAKNVPIDSTLSGTRADGVDWVGSPVLNVAGYVTNMPRTVDQLMINAGSIDFKGQAIIRTGAQLRLEGGFLNYLPGYIQSPRLQGANGLVYDIASADPNVDYTGFAGMFTAEHARWGVTENFTTSPLLANVGRFDPGFIKGGDAGTLTFEPTSAQDIVIDGDLSAHAYAGREQVRTGDLPLAGTLNIIALDATLGSPSVTVTQADAINYVIQSQSAPIESYVPDFDENTPLPGREGTPGDPGNPLWWRPLSTAMIENGGFRKLRLSTNGNVLIRDDAELDLPDGGEVDIQAGSVDVQGRIVTHGGAIGLMSVPTGTNAAGTNLAQAFLHVGPNGVLDASGRWINDSGRAADDLQGDAWIDGGSVSLTALEGAGRKSEDDTANIDLDQGSIIDVSGGGYVDAQGHLAMNGALPAGRGGDVSLQTHEVLNAFDYHASASAADLLGGAIRMDGSLFAEGFSGGGTLTLHAPMIEIGGAPTQSDKIALLYLDPALFGSLGFSRYNLIADTDATVAAGVNLIVDPRYMVADRSALLMLGSSTALLGKSGASAQVGAGEADAYQRYLHRNDGDGLALQAGVYQNWLQNSALQAALADITGTVAIGTGARVEVGAGETIDLSGAGHVVVDGTLVAHGGDIEVNNVGYALALNTKEPVNRSLWLGQNAVLDASGVSLIDPTAGVLPGIGGAPIQQKTGTVSAGGSIDLISDRDLVAEQGAQLLLDGASDTYDLPVDARRAGVDTTAYVASPVWSDAGELTLQAATGLYFDASIDAHGGGVLARGGSLTIAPHTSPTRNLGVQQLIFSQSGWRVPSGGDPYGAVLDKGDNADLRFSVDRLTGSGIDDVTLGSQAGTIPDVVFAGDVDLQMGRSIQINAQHVASIGVDDRKAVFTGSGTAGGQVTLAAPYVSILDTSTSVTPGAAIGVGSLDVQADFLDIGGRVNLSGFGNASFASTGDTRFWVSGDQQAFEQTGWLYTTGNLDFTASRLYPTTAYRFLIDAANPTSDTTVAFHRSAVTDTSTPLSAGGTLAVAADHIVQEGTLWVPSGAIALGTDDPSATLAALDLGATMPLVAAKDVHLAPGSVTSVSLGGAVVPYGTTEDGKDWHYDAQIATADQIIDQPPEKSVSIAGDNVSIDAGAKVDLSGGGYVQAVEWVPGTGGSRDVLAQYQTVVDAAQAGTQVSQYADGRAIYAIVPGYDAPVTAHDASLENGAGAGPAVGQGVYLSGVPGLPDGVYTLLPARYATLPGAYRIVQDTSVTDAVVGRVTTAPDGTQTVGGYFTDTLTGARAARASTFQLQSAQTWGQYSEYTVTSADTFFAAAAARNGDVAPRLGADAGRLSIAASDTLSLGATLDASPAAGGRGSQVDIAGDAIQVLGSGETALDGYLHISADELSQLGAGSLLIGGKRESTTEGDRVDVIASQVLLSNDAGHPLEGSEIILVAGANGGVTLGDGSVLRATATDMVADDPLLIGQTGSDTAPAVSGDGALLRVSGGTSSSAIVRRDITGIDGAAGVASGHLAIGAGATIAAAGTLSMDATGQTRLAPDATLQAKDIDVTAGRIALVGDASGASQDAGTLVVGAGILAQLSNSESTTLRGRQAIELIGGASLAVANDLVLSTPDLTSDGGQAMLSARSVSFTNDTGASSAGTSPGTGTLDVTADSIDLAGGNLTVSGLGRVDMNASSGVFASGAGALDLGAADLHVTTPVVSVGNGADYHLATTGVIQLASGAQAAAPPEDAEGGKLDLEGGSLAVDTDLTAHGGTLLLHATSGDVTLGHGASIDASGLALPFDDTTVHVPGGTVRFEADRGDITVAEGATVNVSGATEGGNAGTISATANAGKATFAGQLAGHAAQGYLGGVLAIDTYGAFDLGDLSARAASGGFDGSVDVHTRQGDLALAAGDTLHAHLVHLTADGGDVSIAGSIDASGTFGGTIGLFGARGVDVDGRLDTSASSAGHHGGDITLGTSGVGDGTLDATYGYENVQADGAGHIRLGATARIVQDGDLGAGTLYLRAPLLANGDVPVTVAQGLDLSHTSSTTLEAYAVWDTQDAATDPSKHFDGLVDAAGWFQADPSTGKPVLVAGTFTDDAGNAIADPDRSDEAQVMDYLSRYRFTPSATNTDHETFYGYVNGDASQGVGTLMGFVEQPGFTFESRLAGVPGLHVRPGIELRNSGTSVADGDISVLTNWNLGAATQDADGTLHPVFRYGTSAEAPVLTLRAEHDLDVHASVTDGFYQVGNAGGSVGGAPADTTWEEASAGWQSLLDTGLGVDGFPDLFGAPTEFTSGDPAAIRDYYTEYVAYADYLMSALPGAPGYRPVDAIAYGLGFGFVMSVPDAPAPLATPTNLNQYVSYLAAYPNYLNQSIALTDFVDTLSVPDVMQTLAPPPTTLDVIDRSAPVDNSPSPRANAANPLPLLSASLAGGNSTSYRFVAGSDAMSVDPLALAGGATGEVTLGGHTEYTDPATGRVIVAPTLVRTGTGDIDIVSAGDIRWTDDRAPAAVYAAGAPAAGTTVDTSVQILQPSTTSLVATATPELVVTGAVNPDLGGHVSLSAGGDILGLQNTVDTTGDITGTPGTPTAQYWWQWMQTGNTDSRSSINFGAFDQGVMSVGGDVSVTAGGDIRQLSVSLPTTWTISTDASGNASLRTIGGGNLSVVAGGDILSGSYFVAKGDGNIHADGSIGADFSTTYLTPTRTQGTMPVSTLIAMQDARLDVDAKGSVSLGGIFNPSWLDDGGVDALSLVGHADGQSYSTTSRIDVTAFAGDLTYGDLVSPLALFTPGLTADVPTESAGDILPATVSLVAANGDLNLRAAGELFPSSDGNLSLLARDSVQFDMPANGVASRYVWGLIDAPLSSMASPLYVDPLTSTDQSPAANVRAQGYLSDSLYGALADQQFLHASTPWHADDSDPVRVYALNGDILNGTGAGMGGVFLMPSKVARIEAGRDIVDLAYVGQQVHASDISVIRAGRDIYDTPLSVPAFSAGGVTNPWSVLPVILQGGPGSLWIQAGRDLGRLAAQTEFYTLGAGQSSYKFLSQPGTPSIITGIDTIANAFNPSLGSDGASVYASFGVSPGIDQAAFIRAYVDPATVKPAGLDDDSEALVAYVENYDAGLRVDTGLAVDASTPTYSVAEAWARFQQLPEEAQAIFTQQAFYRVLAQVGKDYNDDASPYKGQYARGYAAINTLFPASLGYTANGLDGGSNGAGQTVATGDLDIRGSTIQTQRGGDISILGPGGQALLGGTSAPPPVANNAGTLLDGPNTQGVLTLEKGDISMFTDRSTLLAQSRVFTEQGGDVTIWSSNGDINAGKGAKTTSEIPPVTYLCTLDAWCYQNPAGQVSGAGIATLQTIADAPEGSVYLMAPRGTVDAGDAGIRVSGNLVIAAAHVANADNVQVKGDAVGLPVVQSVNVGALNAASSAASAATKAAEDVARQQQSDARDRQPSIISVQVLGDNPSASVDRAHDDTYDLSSPVQVVRRPGSAGDGLTSAERARMTQ